MNYSKNILANIGRVVLSKHPDIAKSIINQVGIVTGKQIGRAHV